MRRASRCAVSVSPFARTAGRRRFLSRAPRRRAQCSPWASVLAVGFYDERMPGWSRDTSKAEFHVEPARGTLRLSLPPWQTTVPLLSSEAQGDDVELAVSIRIVQGLVFEPGKPEIVQRLVAREFYALIGLTSSSRYEADPDVPNVPVCKRKTP